MLIGTLIIDVYFAIPGLSVVTAIIEFITELLSIRKHKPSIGNESPDSSLFKEFLKTLPSSGGIDMLKIAWKEYDLAHKMPSPIPKGYMWEVRDPDDLFVFAREWDNAEHEFLDTLLESKRKKLLSLVQEYLGRIPTLTIATRSGARIVPPEWEDEQLERYQFVIKEFAELAGQIVSVHQDLIRNGKKRLRM